MGSERDSDPKSRSDPIFGKRRRKGDGPWLRLAIDTGGTFTDFVLRDEASGASWFAKTLSTPLRSGPRHPGRHRPARVRSSLPPRGGRRDPDRDHRRDQRHPGAQGRTHRPRHHPRIPRRAHHGALETLRHLRSLARQAPAPGAAARNPRGGRADRPRRRGAAGARPRLGGGGGRPARRRRGGKRRRQPAPCLRQPGPRASGEGGPRRAPGRSGAEPGGADLALLGRIAPPPRVRADQHRGRQRLREADRRPVPRGAGGRLRFPRLHRRAPRHAVQRGPHHPRPRPGVPGQHHRVGAGRRGARLPGDGGPRTPEPPHHLRHGRNHRQGRGHRRRRARDHLHLRSGTG